MAHTVELRLENNGTTISVEMGSTLMEVLHSAGLEQPYPMLAARVNNQYKELSYRIYKPVTVEFFDMRHYEGYRVYQRTLSFVMQKASLELFPKRKLRIRHSLGNGFYAEYGCTGPGSDVSARAAFSRSLTADEAAAITYEDFMASL